MTNRLRLRAPVHLITHAFIVIVITAVGLVAWRAAQAQTGESAKAVAPADGGSNRLPVRRVVLYKNGVGYFEHSARVNGSQELNIDFTTAQLNDVLKSLTVLDLGNGRIASVRYNSIAPLSERLKALRLPFGEQLDRNEFLTALRGARVEVRTDAHSGFSSATGKLLSVDQIKQLTPKGEVVEATEISLITDGGEMRNFELGPGTTVRLADRDLNDEVGRYLNLIGSSRSRDVRRMTISASGSGEREVFVSYISEVPVWKSTYRVILPERAAEGSATKNSKEKSAHPSLQGWAIIDNTIGEDWKDVHLSLVAGAPQSFIQEISQPFYTRRPVIPLPESVQLTPQTHEATLQSDEADRAAATSAPPPALLSSSAEAQTVSAAMDRNVILQGKVRKKEAVPLALNGRNFTQLTGLADSVANQPSEAEAKEVGDFFQYDLKETISLYKNQSALVPILNQPVEADRVTVWNNNSGAQRALWLKNITGQTLDSGTFNILDAGTFAGEGIFSAVHPDERRLLSYAADSAVQVKVETASSQRPSTHIRIFKGSMYLTRENRRSTVYTIHNADNSPRDVVIENPAEDDWNLAKDSPQPEESSVSFRRFRVKVAAAKTEKLGVEEFKPVQSQYVLSSLDNGLVELLVDQKTITPAMKQAFDNILAQKAKVFGFDGQIHQRQQEIDELNNDQGRVRENMKALKGTAEEKALTERYASQLNAQEDRYAALRKEIADLKTQRDRAQRELEDMVTAINLDEGF